MEKIERIADSLLSKLWSSKNTLLHTLGNSLYNVICFVYKILYYPTKEEIIKSINKYGTRYDKQNTKPLIKNIRHDWMHYGVSPTYYFTFNFSHLSKEKKKNYITAIDIGKYSSILNDRTAKKVFDHKYLCYQKYKKYYKRDIIKSSMLNGSFLDKHPSFFFKPENSLLGQGSMIISIKDYPTIQDMKELIPNWDHGICEELIIQDPVMSSFHPKSINTIRTQTIHLYNGEIYLLSTVLKMGRGNGIIDNLAGAGIVADVDTKKGIVISDGVDDWNHTYKNHPDTGVPIRGTVIPKWDEACQLAKEVAKMSPSVRYISLDIALTKNGWVIVEGNAQGAFLRQVCNKRGYKKEFEKLIRG